ncbi:MAG: serine/threonine protein kinase [Actinobacteria bacterium]|nr:MAG: serine/threonine protein kinase [Actinomycetota bacterium]
MAAIELAPGAGLCGGRYRVESLLGSGGMATVWQAHDERLDRPVAIKALADNLAVDEGYVARFQREARLSAKLSHPYLVQVFDYGTEQGRPFLVMEYVDGPTLAERLAEGWRAEDTEALALARHLLGALAHIHAAGILHRDVKPGNVLLDHERIAKLTDFGIAQPAEATRLTEVGLVMGTARYMAPELSAGERPTSRSDLYACGVLLEEATGPDSPAPLRDLIAALTATEPIDRPLSADDALARLETQPTAPPEPPATEPTQQLGSRAPGASRVSRGRGEPGRRGPGAPLARLPRGPRAALRTRRREPLSSRQTTAAEPAGERSTARPGPAPGLGSARVQRPRPRLVYALPGALMVLVLVVVLGTSGGGSPRTPGPAPAGAPLHRQLDALQHTLDSVKRR